MQCMARMDALAQTRLQLAASPPLHTTNNDVATGADPNNLVVIPATSELCSAPCRAGLGKDLVIDDSFQVVVMLIFLEAFKLKGSRTTQACRGNALGECIKATELD